MMTDSEEREATDCELPPIPDRALHLPASSGLRWLISAERCSMLRSLGHSDKDRKQWECLGFDVLKQEPRMLDL
jgi:hypothetical protein